VNYFELVDQHRCFGGEQRRYRHWARTLDCDMHFSLFVPPQASEGPVPILYWLSGLTCTDENFVTKAGAQRTAAAQGVAILAPDTSPRGDGVPDDPRGAYDFGLGAGFYVNASEPPYNQHYHMWDYVVDELPELVHDRLPMIADRAAISGHSMGGHGALTIALRHPGRYVSVSAFAPICSPTRCPWGQKALTGYLGEDRTAWARHDASLLIRNADPMPIMIDQGENDEFLESQLKPELLLEAAAAARVPIDFRSWPGYDHSYFFIASFISEHVGFHARHLGVG